MPTEGLRTGKIEGQTQAKCMKNVKFTLSTAVQEYGTAVQECQHAQAIEHGYATSLDHPTRPCSI